MASSALPSRDNCAKASPGAEKNSDEDPLLHVSAQEYLEQTIMVTLTLGLEDVCRIRPSNPVDYLGLYLLRRSESSNVVEVPFEDTQPAKPGARAI